MGGHCKALLTLTILLPIAFIIVCVFNGLNGADTPIYTSRTGDISDKYNLEITPAGWTFTIWGFIYAWQALWIVYAIVNLFRKSEKGPFYANPDLLNISFLVNYLVNMGLNVAWMILFDRELLEGALAVLFSMVVTLCVCMFFSYRSLDYYIDTLIEQKNQKDVWLTRMLVQNGLGIYATWCAIATLLNFAFVLAYRSAYDISVKDASTASLSVLSVIILVFYVVDLGFTDRWTRYTFTPYIVFVVALAGVQAKNYDAGARNTIFVLVLQVIVGLGLPVKFFMMSFRHCRKTVDGVKISDGIKV